METKYLGKPTATPFIAGRAILDRVPNPHPKENFVARFTCPEFTSLCPVTGQPDFGIFVIDYVPDRWLLESKVAEALHVLLPQSRRVPRGLHAYDRQAHRRHVKPRFLRIASYWNPRGGIPIDVFWQTGKLPAGVSLPRDGDRCLSRTLLTLAWVGCRLTSRPAS